MSEILIDGSMDWAGGVDSVKTTTLQSEMNPNGLARNELAWLNNGTVRDGGISPRSGWSYLFDIADSSSKYQGGFLYEPTDDQSPYLVVCLSGELFWIDIISGTITNISDAAYSAGHVPHMMPATVERVFFCQAEEFLVIQAGDYVTNPLIWFGTFTNLMHQSMGTNPTVNPGQGGVSQIPAAGPMDYYMGRLWYARGRQYGAGDLVGGPSGTLDYGTYPPGGMNFRNSIFEVTENPLCVSGLDFTVPSEAGNIRALKHSANLNTQLGQGLLYVFTRKAVYSMEVPISRQDWIAAGNQQAYDFATGIAIPTAQGQMPVQKVVQLVNGSVNDLSIVPINGDLYYQSFEPGIRSLITAIRNFEEPGNIQISAPLNRLTKFNDRELMRFSSGIQFDNRLLETQLPFQTDQGVASKAVAVLDFIPLSTNRQQKTAIWEGMYEGLQFLQLFEGDFGGRPRAFATVRSEIDGRLQLWELTYSQNEDVNESGFSRFCTIIEFPAYTFNDAFKLKKLVSAELWFDRLIGSVDFQMHYRVDGDHCWNLWHMWQECSAKDSTEDIPPTGYPVVPYCDTYRWSKTLPLPPASCATASRRPMNIGYQFQPRLIIKGTCRLRGMLLKAEKVEDSLYSNLVC